jgi:iron complex transport system substrate-binding protein
MMCEMYQNQNRRDNHRKKTTLLVLLVLVLLVFLSVGCKKAEKVPLEEPKGGTTVFTDSCGRKVEIPKNITRVAPSGATAQMVLMTIAPETLVGLTSTPSSKQMAYFPENMWHLPTFGQFYGSKSNLNMEALIDARPQVIIDIGDRKATHKRDMDAIQKQTGVPTIFIEATLDGFPQAYRTLGQVLGKEAEAEERAKYIEGILAMTAENTRKLDGKTKPKVMFGTGSTGLNCNAKGSVQADVIEKVGAENAIVPEEEVSNANGGNVVGMEEVYRSKPDAILLAAGGPYDEIKAGDGQWSRLDAVKKGKYYEIPGVPYSWMSSPPSVNRIIGILWLGNLLYPDIYNYDMVEKTQEFYKLFWNYDISREDVESMLSKSTMREQK